MKYMTACVWNMECVTRFSVMMNNPFVASEDCVRPCTVWVSSSQKGYVRMQKPPACFLLVVFVDVSIVSRMYPFTIQWHEKGDFFPSCEKYFSEISIKLIILLQAVG